MTNDSELPLIVIDLLTIFKPVAIATAQTDEHEYATNLCFSVTSIPIPAAMMAKIVQARYTHQRRFLTATNACGSENMWECSVNP